MNSPLLQRLIDIAKAEIGRKETEGSNLGPDVVKYQEASWLPPGAWPWCAAFTAWCLREWLKAPDVQRALNVTDPERWRCKDARAFGWKDWAQKQGLQTFHEHSLAKAGDIVIYDFSHIGFVIRDQAEPEAPIETVEGNTNAAGSRDGDGVWQKRRHYTLTDTYIRLL